MENENAIVRPGNWIRRLVKANEENAAAKPRTWVRRLVKVVGYVSVALMALYLVTSLAWRFSGSNKWEFVEERNGVKVYTLKSPGSDLEQIRCVVRLRSTLGGVIKFLHEPATTTNIGYHDNRTIEQVDHWLLYGTFQFDLPFPFKPREFVIRSWMHQHPVTKEVQIAASAAPDKLPPNDCCVRVTGMNNTWRFTPLDNGQVELEYTYNTDFGGFIPAVLLNKQRLKFVPDAISKLQGMLEEKHFQNAKLDYIKEKGD
jgi:hypothetical protein